MKARSGLAFAAVLVATRPALADAARVVSALPDASIERPQDPPTGVASAERVKGIWVSTPQSLQPKTSSISPRGPAAAVVVASAPLSIDIARGSSTVVTLGVAALDPKADACIRSSGDGAAWTAPAATAATVLERQPTDAAVIPVDTARETAIHDVWMVRAERFVDGTGDQASLEQIDAWVDLRTGGAREVGRHTVALTLVRRFSGGLAVYGAQQDKRVMFVVRPPKASLVADGAPPAPVMVLGTGEGTQGFCGHRTVMVSVEEAGQSASEAIAGEVSVPLEEPGAGKEGKESPTFKARPFRLTLTESWSKGEASPAIGASFGWTGVVRQDAQQLATPQRPRFPGRKR